MVSVCELIITFSAGISKRQKRTGGFGRQTIRITATGAEITAAVSTLKISCSSCTDTYILLLLPAEPGPDQVVETVGGNC